MGERDVFEAGAFWTAWLLAGVHAALQSRPVQQGRIAPAWRQQCYASATLAIAAVALNWITTGEHLGRSIARGYWPVAGFDLVLLAAAAIALMAARRLRLREKTKQRDNDDIEAEVLEPAHG